MSGRPRRILAAAGAGKPSGGRSGVSPAIDPELAALAERLPLWRRPGYLVRRLHQLHSALFLEECGRFGVTPVQYGLLTVLSTRPDCDQISLANALGIDRTNVADVLGRLERAGLVARRRHDADRRMVLSRLTKRGERLVKDMHPAMARAQERLLDGLNDAERATFVALVARLLEGRRPA